MHPGIRLRAARFAPILPCVLVAAVAGARPAEAQVRDARLPRPGRLWFEIQPELLNWSEQFAKDSPDPNLVDGDREPLFADLDGPIAARLFPGPAPFVSDLNADAAIFGFDPLDEEDLSLGRLDFSNVNVQIRRLAVGFEVGLVDRVAIGVRAPFTMTEVDPAFAFDSATANVTLAASAFGAGNPFLTDARTALGSLEALIAGGTLTGGALDQAIALRDGTDAFLTALETRALNGGLIPTGPSGAGTMMAERFGNFVSGFGDLGIVLPALALPSSASTADLVQWFEGAPISGRLPGLSRRTLNLGEIELSARFGLIDRITPREPGDAAAGEGDAATPLGRDPAAPAEPSGIRLRTAVGALVRLPTGSASLPPFQDTRDFLDLPIGDGQTDIELAWYQDLALGGWLVVRAAGRYGIQLSDRVRLRVHPPDRPYALAATETVVRRDLGDYVEVTIRPSLRVNSALQIGLEYDYWHLAASAFALGDPLPDVPDASPLEIETEQTRHAVGLGFTYDLSAARGREHPEGTPAPVRSPWQFSVSIRRAVAGSGGQTPAAFRYAAAFRVPIGIF